MARSRRLPEKRLLGMIQRASEETGMPASWLRALVQQESGGDPTARSHAGAYGLTQLMPGTAEGLGLDTPQELNDPYLQLQAGARYFMEQYNRFGDMTLALAAYNAGPGNVQKHGGVPPFEETQNYVKRVAELEKGYRGLEAGGEGAAFDVIKTGSQAPNSTPLALTERGTLDALASRGSSTLRNQAMATRPEDAATAALSPFRSERGTPLDQPAIGSASMQSLSSLRPQEEVIEMPGQADLQRLIQGLQQVETTVDGQPVQPMVDTAFNPPGDQTVGGLNQELARRFAALQAEIRRRGGNLVITSGARDAREQAILWNKALQKYGDPAIARKWVAPPGKSNHDPTSGTRYGLGPGAVASDVKGDLQLAHELAPQFGLVFPLSNEAWHIELAGIRDMKG